MTLTLEPELEARLAELAKQQGMTAEEFVHKTLLDRYVPIIPRDDWERRVLAQVTDFRDNLHYFPAVS